MYKRILVPLDGSDVAKQALPYATGIAQALGARVDLLEAVSPFPRELMRAVTREYGNGTSSYPPSPDQWARIQEQSHSAAEQRLAAAAKAVPSPTETRNIVVADDPADAIAEEAKRESGTLIAISTHGRSGLGRWVLGSVTDKVIRIAESPVLIVRAREQAPAAPRITRIILPLDGSEGSEAALQPAVDLAKSLGVGVTLLRSISPMVYGDTFADYVPAMYEDLSAEIEGEVHEYLEATAKRVRDMGIADVDQRSPDGYAAATIIDEAGEAGDKLVVMATRARSGVGRWVLGSVTDRVVRHAGSPVLVVRPRQP